MIRPLPVAVALMLALVVVKAGNLLLHGFATVRVVPSAVAATGTGEGGRAVPAETASGNRPPAAHPAAEKAAAPAKPAPDTASNRLPPPGPPPPTDAEMKLLTDLRGRRTAMDGREEALSSREAVVAAAEQRLAARAGELESLQARLQALEATRREHDEANWRGLVRTYEAMKPKDAATIMTELDDAVLLPVLDRMKESKAAPILSAMPPDRARAVTAQLAQIRLHANTLAGGG